MPHLTPPPQREAVGSTAGRPHLLSGSGEVPPSPLCSTPLRDPPEIRGTLGGVLRWLCGQRAPRVGSPNACFELRPLCSGSPSPPPARQAMWGRPSSSSPAPWGAARSQRQLGTRPPRTPLTAALRPQPLSLRLSSPLLPLRIPPRNPPLCPPGTAPCRCRCVPLPPTRCATHFRPPPLRTRLEPIQLEANLTFLLPHISLTQVLNYHCPREMSA